MATACRTRTRRSLDLGWDPGWATAFLPFDAAGWQPARVVAAHRDAWVVAHARRGDRDAVGLGPAPPRVDRDPATCRPSATGWRSPASTGDGAPTVVQAVLPRRTAFMRSAGEERLAGDPRRRAGPRGERRRGVRRRGPGRRLQPAPPRALPRGGVERRRDARRRAQQGRRGRRTSTGSASPPRPWRPGVDVRTRCPRSPATASSALAADHLPRGRTAVVLGLVGRGQVHARQRARRQRAPAHRPRSATTTRAAATRRPIASSSACRAARSSSTRQASGRSASTGAADGLDDAFADIAELASTCRFSDCRHEGEPGCGDQGRARRRDGSRADRLASHRKLEREAAHVARANDPLLRAEERRKWKAIHVSVNQHMQRKYGERPMTTITSSRRRPRIGRQRDHVPPLPGPRRPPGHGGRERAAARRDVGILEPVDVEGDAAPVHAPRELGPARGLHRHRARRRHGQGYARIEWHDLVDGDRLYDMTLLVAPAALGHGRRAVAVAAGRRSGGARWRRPTRPTGARASPTTCSTATSRRRPRSSRGLRARAAGTPRCSGRPSTAIGRRGAPGRLRDPDPRGRRAARGVRDVGRGVRTSTGASPRRASSDIEEWIEDPRFRRDLEVVRVPGDEPAACVSNSRGDAARRVAPGPARRGRDAPGPPSPRPRAGGDQPQPAAAPRRGRDVAPISAWTRATTIERSQLYESCGFRQASSGTNYRKPLGRREGADDDRYRARGGGSRSPAPRPSRGSGSAGRRTTTGRRWPTSSTARAVPTASTRSARPSRGPPSTRTRSVPARARHARGGARRQGRRRGARATSSVRDGALVGETSGAVVPEHRRQGIGGALYRATHERLAAAAAADPRPGPRELRSYAMDRRGRDRALLDANGYVPIRFGFEMRRYLTGALPEHPSPPASSSGR